MECDNAILFMQIGHPLIYNICTAFSVRDTGITLNIGDGYFVDIDLTVWDTYEVKRVFLKNGRRTIKGVIDDVYFDTLSDIVFQASQFETKSFGEDKL